MSAIPQQSARLLTITALAMLAGWLLAPTTARAECGDYVMVGGQHAHTTQPAPSKPAPMPAKPCDGPGCRQSPSAPMLPPPAAPIVVNPVDWACLIARIDPITSTSCRHALRDDPGHPIHQVQSIFHPPRAI